MKHIIEFTCPQCSAHQLMLVERAMHRSIVQLKANEEGKLMIARKNPVDDLCGEPLGYRCAAFRYPDCTVNDSPEAIQWKSLEDVWSAGVITRPNGMKTVEHKCMICFPDGKMIPVIVETAHAAPLGERERRLVLKRVHALQGVLITAADSGIRSLACPNWKRVQRCFLQPTSPMMGKTVPAAPAKGCSNKK